MMETRYFNEKKQKMKTEIRKDYFCEGIFCTPKIVQMFDHTRGDRTTIMTLREFKGNTGVSDSYFTVRALQRGN